MKTVLLLTDFSKSAKNAMHYAMRFFESENCTFYILHVHKTGTFISDDLMSSPTQSIYDSITQGPKRNIKLLITELESQYNNEKHEFHTVVDFDVFTDAVKQAVHKYAIDFVVMGSNGATGAREVLFGSNTINVIRTVMCKTIVVPENYTYTHISNFLLPLQQDDIIDEEYLNAVLELSNRLDFKSHILRITTSQEFTAIASKDRAILQPLNYEYTLETNIQFYNAVSEYLKVYDMDMVGLIVHDKSIIKRLFTATPTLELSKVIKKPLLLFHTEKDNY